MAPLRVGHAVPLLPLSQLLYGVFSAGCSAPPMAHSFYPAKGQNPARVLPHMRDVVEQGFLYPLEKEGEIPVVL